ncbi:glycosyltransferase involved in cell wall biosynthesis [Actinoallomurus bryophytorum]|uniref:Glycosyltransferase involved in cell wall biosynthesis n=1 Tax=Actinoallomurus bryophytorum TaxID=1490222 RepID=A0A543BTR8_9ACTN|nr:glycosyltransferase [Actinoallomurus bryophytorum]TQL88221.1 glycosyltransferase involved in cell wall biosynthesis [Actinoallomurus bryophytorum]
MTSRPLRGVDRPSSSPAVPLSRVCLLIGQLGLGGTEKQVVLLAQGLQARGIETSVCLLFEGGPREHVLKAAGVPVVYLGFPSSTTVLRKLPGNIAAFARLVRHLRRQRPDVLHAFLYHSYVTAAPAARLARVKVLVAGRRSLGDFKEGRRVLLAIERVATSITDHLVANAESVAEDTIRNEGVRPDKITTVYNGLPDSAFEAAAPAGLPAESPVILCVANLKVYKGHRFLLEAVARLHDRNLRCTLVLVGKGPERHALEEQAARLKIDVRFLGTRTDVEALLARADVAVLPSLHEGMSNAVMEAMAAGLPVVATEVGGTGELLRGRGILVPPSDSEALADGLGQVLADPALAARLGAAARAWSRERLHVDAMVDRHVALYRELLERRCAE